MEMSQNKAGETNTRNETVLKNIRLVHSVANRYTHSLEKNGIDYDDLVSLGTIGLIKAIENFDISYGTKLSTYAVPMIQGEIRRFIRDNHPGLKLPRGLKELISKIVRLDLQDIKVEELETLLGKPSKDIKEALSLLGKVNPRSIHAEISSVEDENTTLEDRLPSYGDYTNIFVEDFINSLTPKYQIVIRMQLQYKTQTQIASVLGVSQVQVSRMQRKIKDLYIKYNKERTMPINQLKSQPIKREPVKPKSNKRHNRKDTIKKEPKVVKSKNIAGKTKKEWEQEIMSTIAKVKYIKSTYPALMKTEIAAILGKAIRQVSLAENHRYFSTIKMDDSVDPLVQEYYATGKIKGIPEADKKEKPFEKPVEKPVESQSTKQDAPKSESPIEPQLGKKKRGRKSGTKMPKKVVPSPIIDTPIIELDAFKGLIMQTPEMPEPVAPEKLEKPTVIEPVAPVTLNHTVKEKVNPNSKVSFNYSVSGENMSSEEIKEQIVALLNFAKSEGLSFSLKLTKAKQN